MGSPKVFNAKPQLPMENKPVKTPLLSSLKNLFKDKKKEKAKHEKATKIKEERTKLNDVKHENKNENEVTVANILKRFENLDIKVQRKEEQIEDRKNSTEEEEFSHFKFKIIEDDRKRHSSEDSGYSEAKEDSSKEDQEILDSFDKLKIEHQGQKDESKKEENRDKKKYLKKVLVSRTPIRPKVCDYNVDPYTARQVNHQVNQQALCGGQVFVTAPDNYNEVDQALTEFKKLSQTSNQTEYWQDLLEVIDKDSKTNEDEQKIEDFLKDVLQKEKPEDLLEEFEEFKEFLAKDQGLCIDVVPNAVTIPNVIEEFSESHNLPVYEETIDMNNPLLSFENVPDYTKMESIYPTPPRSETVPSPLPESQAFYPPTCATWENSRSPERSSPTYNSDYYERYQDLSHEELSPVSENDEQNRQRINSVSSLTRTNSISSITMKNFKDMQKDIGNEFSKKDCCLINRKSCKELFDEHMSQLKTTERKNLCFNVAKMELKTAYGVLQHIILSAATSSDQLDLQHALFVLVCQRVLAQSPALFIGDFGLSILKSAVMRCPHRPILTRFIVHYVYAALRNESTAPAQKWVFHEVDALGDNLIIACARGGDAYASVLAEITRAEVSADLPSLFRIDHANTDGYTALHVACSLHSAGSSRLHTLHVLLEHAQADLWKGDIKGGDTALHLAVNSANCDLRVILMIFKQIDRKMWKKLAHFQNMSSVTPLEYARSATKSTTRQNYPHEVLDFLKKCR